MIKLWRLSLFCNLIDNFVVFFLFLPSFLRVCDYRIWRKFQCDFGPGEEGGVGRKPCLRLQCFVSTTEKRLEKKRKKNCDTHVSTPPSNKSPKNELFLEDLNAYTPTPLQPRHGAPPINFFTIRLDLDFSTTQKTTPTTTTISSKCRPATR
jgi:hypothetical protein